MADLLGSSRVFKAVDSGAGDVGVLRPLLRGQPMRNHVADPDPHGQYAKETDVLQNFVFASYGGIQSPAGDSAFQDLGAGRAKLDFLTQASIANPLRINQDLANAGLEVTEPGVYLLTASMSFSHDSSNSGRKTHVELFNEVSGQPLGGGFVVGTGRNSEATNVSVSVPFEVSPAAAVDGNLLVLRIGNGDTYSSVVFTSASFSLHSIGLYSGSI